jgi:hypothetical protein
MSVTCPLPWTAFSEQKMIAFSKHERFFKDLITHFGRN